ncbi:MAG TPA: 2OG-Fe dioxygenase family protein [Steroidobacteraceae bacterium]|nr:2OG-Fe dioxygenase family protein [Steroidobacteraceae bacterium]
MWDDLEPDRYMADGGRYRRRRFAVAALVGSQLTPEPHQPHVQSRDANPLNGGIDRWFAPILPARLVAGPLAAIIDLCREVFALSEPAPSRWRVEAHQFRIEAREMQPGLPTPEGVHRDGVDWAFVMLVRRENTAGGVTTIFDAAHCPLGSFTLAEPMQAVFIDDHRIFHGVTPISALEAARPAFRDVLVITFTRRPQR